MRAAFALAIAGCYTNQPSTTKTSPTTTSTPAASDAASNHASTPPADLSPPTTGLAVAIAGFVVVDDAGSRVFARSGFGINVLALDSGKQTGRIDLAWEGELWPAGKNLIETRANGLVIDAMLVDPATAKTIASCSATAKGPAGSQIMRIDEFTTHAGTTYLKWETSPPPRMRGGAAMTQAQIEEMSREFQAAYACGLYAVHVTGTTCTLDVASYKDAGLESCETRSMPGNRYLPTPIGSLALRVDRSSTTRNNLMIDLETLVVSNAAGKELWRLQIETRATPPPAP